MEPAQLSFFVMLFGTSVLAFKFGEKPEIQVAVAVAVAATVTPLAETTMFENTEFGILLVDLCLLALLLKVVFTTDRRWAIFASGFHLATILTHAAPMLVPGLLPGAYATASVFWAYLVLGSLAVGSLSLRKGAQ